MNIIHKCTTTRKTAVVTGATSGIGRDIARQLRERGYHLIITGRNEKELKRLVCEFSEKYTTAVSADLADKKECLALYRLACEYNTEVLVNNAGFGMYGEFAQTSLSKEMDMLDVNVRAVHILMKLFLRRFAWRNYGYILNVASSAGYVPGPFMSVYYATKSYIVSLTASVYEEIKRRGLDVHISMLCPGPVKTDFNSRAGVRGKIDGITSAMAASEAVEGMFAGKLEIIPTAGVKAICYLGGALPKKLSAFANYYVQKLNKSRK